MSFALLGFKWGAEAAGTTSGVITWSADFVTELSHSAAHSDTDFETSLQAAFDRWEEVASVDFQQVASGGALQIGAGDLDAEGTDVLGVAYTPYTVRVGLDEITSATIDFDTSGRFWSPEGSDGTDFYAVALHEIGHVLGLGHPSPDDPTEIMNAFLSTDELGDGDMTGIQQLYGTDPGDELAPTDSGTIDGSGEGIDVGKSLAAVAVGFLLGPIWGLGALMFSVLSGDGDTSEGPMISSLTGDDDVSLEDLIPMDDHHDDEHGPHEWHILRELPDEDDDLVSILL